MVLPSPLGATRMTLVISLRNSRDISASISARSQRSGQAQSKSLKGLKRPLWVSARRPLGEGGARSFSSQSSSAGTQPALMASCQCINNPLRCSALARVCKGSRSVCIGGLLELVIGIEGVGGHRSILGPNVLGQGHGDGRGLVALLAAAVEDEAHGIRMGNVAGERLEDGGLQLACAIAGQQLHQSCGDAAEVVAALGGTHEQGLTGRRGRCEVVGGAMAAAGVAGVTPTP